MVAKTKVVSLAKKKEAKKTKRQMKLGTKKMMTLPFRCPLCADKKILPIQLGTIEEHMIITRDSTNHFHIHGPIGNVELIKEFIQKIAKEAGIDIEDEDAE